MSATQLFVVVFTGVAVTVVVYLAASWARDRL